MAKTNAKQAAANLVNTVWEDVTKAFEAATAGAQETFDSYTERNAQALDDSINVWKETLKATMQIPGFYGIYNAIVESIVKSGGSAWKLSRELQDRINEFVEDAELFGSNGMKEAIKRQFRKDEKGNYQPLALTALSCIFAAGKRIEKKLKQWGADMKAHPVLGGIANAVLGVGKVVLGMAKMVIDGAITIALTIGAFVIKGIDTIVDLFLKIFNKIKETIVTLKKGDDDEEDDFIIIDNDGDITIEFFDDDEE